MGKLTAIGKGLGALEEAFKEAQAVKKFPIELTRAPALTKEEIDKIANRVARQQSGEHVRLSEQTGNPKDAANLAGRSGKESRRVQGTNYTLEPTREVRPTPTYESQIGDVNIALPGDQTISDKRLVNVNGLPVGSNQQGGSMYGEGKLHLDDPLFWASGTDIAQQFQDKVTALAKLYNTDRVTAYHLAMGSASNNYAMHFADANLKAIANSDVSPQAIAQFNDMIRKGYKDDKGKHVPLDHFVGVENPEQAYMQMMEDPGLRKWFNNRMKLDKFTTDIGLPNGKDIQYAITEPTLRNMEINLTGNSVGRMKPGAELTDTADHFTYKSGISGESLGQAPELSPFEVSFPDATQYVRATQRPQDFTGTIQKVFPHQVVDDQHLQQMSEYYKRLREIRGFAKGGKVGEDSANLEDNYKLADMIHTEPSQGGLNYRDYPNEYGLRAYKKDDGTYGGEMLPKYTGWLDKQNGEGKERGHTMTEYSIDDEKGSYPTFVPTLNAEEIHSLRQGKLTPSIIKKATAWRDSQEAKGESAFKNPKGFGNGGRTVSPNYQNYPTTTLEEPKNPEYVFNNNKRPVTPKMEFPSANVIATTAKILGRKAVEQFKKETANPSPQMLRDIALNASSGILGMPSDMIEGARGEPMKGYKPFNTSEMQQSNGLPMFGSENLKKQLKNYGLTSGTERPLLDNVAMMFGPGAIGKVGKLAKMTKGLPVGLSIKDVSPNAVKFTSTLNKTVDSHKMDAMPGPQWSAWLKSNAPKSAKKEAESTGLNDWLATQGKVTKEDIKAHTEANRPEIKAVTRSALSKLTKDDYDKLKDLDKRNYYGDLSSEEYTDLIRLENRRDQHSVGSMRAQQISQENSARQAQRNGDPFMANQRFKIAEHLGNRADELELNPSSGGGTKFGNWQLPNGENYKETTFALPPNKTGNNHQAPLAHAYGNEESDVNRVAHIRTNERPTSDDKRALFLEELQSDWAQHGRDKGFKPSMTTKETQELNELYKKFKSSELSDEEYPRFNELYNFANTSVPSGPYVQDTKDWTALSLKHALKQAVDEGHDYLGWTNGSQQAKRYDLGQHIDRVDHDMNPDGTYNLSAIKNGQEVFSEEDIPAEKIAEHVGKEVAEKIIKGEGIAPKAVGKMEPVEGERYRNLKSLSGLDLQVGGEGMKGYYDQIVPQTLNDVLKQIGAKERVKTIPLNTNTHKYQIENIDGTVYPNEFDSKGDAIDYLEARGDDPGHYAFNKIMDEQPNHQGIEITPELRQLIQDNGLPHFHHGGEVAMTKTKHVKIQPIDLEVAFKLSKFKD